MDKIFFLLFAILFLSGCYNSNFNEEVVYKGKPQILSFSSDSSTQTVSFYANEDGYLKYKNEWYKVTVNSTEEDNASSDFGKYQKINFSGNRPIQLLVKSTANETENSKNDSIEIFTNNQEASLYIIVRQDALKGKISILPKKSFIIPFDKSQLPVFTLNTNLDWTLSSNNDNLKASVISGKKHTNIDVSITDNEKLITDQTGYISITAGKEVSEIVDVCINGYFSSDEYDSVRFSIADEQGVTLDSIKSYGDGHLLYQFFVKPNGSSPMSFRIKEKRFDAASNLPIDVYANITLEDTSSNSNITVTDNVIYLNSESSEAISFFLKDQDSTFCIAKGTTAFNARPIIRGATSLNVTKGHIPKLECIIQSSDPSLNESLEIKWYYRKNETETWTRDYSFDSYATYVAKKINDESDVFYYKCIVEGIYHSNIVKTTLLSE